MFGTYERRGDQLSFTPRHPLLHAHRYRAAFGPAGGKAITAEYRVPPRPPAPAPVVEKVYPSADVLPANHLRFHIRFSRPMRGGKEIFQHIRILDAKGKEVTSPWLPDELWADDDRSLILYIHPGRIKWGLLLRMLLGPVLEPGREYTLVIGAEMLDADGRRLGKEYTKKFRTTAEDRTRIDLTAWKLQAPAARARRSRWPSPRRWTGWGSSAGSRCSTATARRSAGGSRSGRGSGRGRSTRRTRGGPRATAWRWTASWKTWPATRRPGLSMSI